MNTIETSKIGCPNCGEQIELLIDCSIGHQEYIEDCRRGYQALNYKDYTFFLDPSLNVNQTHGRHNSHTPSSIIEELQNLIEAA